jgi:beta-glucosidase
MANTKQIGPSSSGASSGDTNSQVDLQVLHEIYWQPHEALVDAGVATIMCSYA